MSLVPSNKNGLSEDKARVREGERRYSEGVSFLLKYHSHVYVKKTCQLEVFLDSNFSSLRFDTIVDIDPRT